jgi:GxxExxY protein
VKSVDELLRIFTTSGSPMNNSNEQRDPKTYAVIGAAIEVHRELGCGFLEAVYHEGLAIELAARRIPFVRELVLPVHYKGQLLPVGYRADFVCYEEVIVELKALRELTTVDEAQLLNYLKATGYSVGLLLNFGTASLQWKRLMKSPNWSPPESEDKPPWKK